MRELNPLELRIGNWFKWSGFASMGRGYDRIDKAQIIDYYKNFKEPISVNHEVLQLSTNLTFHQEGNLMLYTLYLQDSQVTFEWNHDHLEYYDGDLCTKIYTVHHLQNLVFFLTNQELEVKFVNPWDNEKPVTLASLIKPIKYTTAQLLDCGWDYEGSEWGDCGAVVSSQPHTTKGYSFLVALEVGEHGYIEEEQLGLWIFNDYGNESIHLPLEKVQYRHQIKDLYFSFTGLTLDLPPF